MTIVEALRMLNGMGLQFPASDVKNALNSIDQEAIENEVLSHYTVQIWDLQEPINNINPEAIRTRGDWAGGLVYLIYKDGNLMILQPFDPFQSGFSPITEDNVNTIAQQHIKQIAQQEINDKIIEELVNVLIGE